MYIYKVISDFTPVMNAVWFTLLGPGEQDTPQDQLIGISSCRRFLVHQDKVYRICEIDLDEEEYVKVWIDDPFKEFEDYGFEDYPQLPELNVKTHFNGQKE